MINALVRNATTFLASDLFQYLYKPIPQAQGSNKLKLHSYKHSSAKTTSAEAILKTLNKKVALHECAETWIQIMQHINPEINAEKSNNCTKGGQFRFEHSRSDTF